MYSDLERVKEEGVITYLKVLSWHLPVITEEGSKIL
jgi:hypothetical protein